MMGLLQKRIKEYIEEAGEIWNSEGIEKIIDEMKKEFDSIVLYDSFWNPSKEERRLIHETADKFNVVIKKWLGDSKREKESQ